MGNYKLRSENILEKGEISHICVIQNLDIRIVSQMFYTALPREVQKMNVMKIRIESFQMVSNILYSGPQKMSKPVKNVFAVIYKFERLSIWQDRSQSNKHPSCKLDRSPVRVSKFTVTCKYS